MKESDFEKLCDGIKEAGAYSRGEGAAARITDLELPPIREIRANLSQAEFADRIKVSVRTLQNWEQGQWLKGIFQRTVPGLRLRLNHLMGVLC